MGKVDSVAFGHALNKVVISAHLEQNAGILAAEGTRFWIVKPELGLAEVSHLGTLVTGDYIAVRPAKKKGKPNMNLSDSRSLPLRNQASRG